MNRPKTDILSVRINKDIIEKIDEIAALEGQDRNAIARQIIENHFNKKSINNFIPTHKKLDKILNILNKP